jgi:ribosomal protein L34
MLLVQLTATRHLVDAYLLLLSRKFVASHGFGVRMKTNLKQRSKAGRWMLAVS